MSNKAYTLILVVAGIIILLVGGYVGYSIKKDKPCPTISDSIHTIGIPYPVPYPVEVIKWKDKQSGTPDIDSTVYSAVFDSQFVSNKDTVDIVAEVSFDNKSKEFDMNMDIEVRGVDIVRVDTIKVNFTETKEVEVNNPLWITITATSILGMLLALIALVVGG